ncbi:MAG: hypothetical protein OXF57_06490 [Rhodospirillaceae bacterium]|nr:hypothetical protein [Rhodospirillaceae bacterium]
MNERDRDARRPGAKKDYIKTGLSYFASSRKTAQFRDLCGFMNLNEN